MVHSLEKYECYIVEETGGGGSAGILRLQGWLLAKFQKCYQSLSSAILFTPTPRNVGLEESLYLNCL